MSAVLRFCNKSTSTIEHFIGFLAVAETTLAKQYLAKAILEELEKNGFDIQN